MSFCKRSVVTENKDLATNKSGPVSPKALCKNQGDRHELALPQQYLVQSAGCSAG